MNINFIIGSKAFFGDLKDYKSKDEDLLVIDDKIESSKGILHCNLDKNKDVFICGNLSKTEFLNDTVISNYPLKVGKFLVPKFAEYIKLTINELKSLEFLFNKLDSKHKYEKLIFDYYIENGSFTLTDKQLNKVYKVYIKNRNYNL